MVYKRLIEKYKSIRKQSYLNTLGKYRFNYAFAGVGHHSISCLYPCLQSLGVPLKFVFSRNISNAQKLSQHFQGCTGTANVNDIVNSADVKALFICTDPSQHYSLAKKALEAGKDVFIEKPPCGTLQELKTLVSVQNNNICMVGLQRRFSTVNRLLRKHRLLKNATSYLYRYCTGLFPEGDPVTELFIHPIDNSVQLFGEITDLQVKKLDHNPGLGFHLLINHQNNVHGMIELSTGYSWNTPVETLEVNTKDRIVRANYPNELRTVEKPVSILEIPAEKVFSSPVVEKVYFNNTGFVPGISQNNLAVQGFYPEIKHFISLTEQQKTDRSNDIASLLPVYAILEKLASASHGK